MTSTGWRKRQIADKVENDMSNFNTQQMRNRYGDRYEIKHLSEDTYTIAGDLKYWRFGGREGQATIDMGDLGFVDPSGGPFIGVGCKIDGREIVRIAYDENVTPHAVRFTVK
jgi:hypothetical protein